MNMFDLLKLLANAKVEFVLVGGLAVALRGYSRFTMDVDVVLAMDGANLRRFIEVATEAGLHPTLPVPLETLAQPELMEQWCKEKGMLAFSLRSREAIATVLDVLVRPVITFEELRKDASLLDIGSVQVAVASIEHLITMKTGTGRSKDQIDIEELRKIQSSNE